jgi:hypothetical protein
VKYKAVVICWHGWRDRQFGQSKYPAVRSRVQVLMPKPSIA